MTRAINTVHCRGARLFESRGGNYSILIGVICTNPAGPENGGQSMSLSDDLLAALPEGSVCEVRGLDALNGLRSTSASSWSACLRQSVPA